MAAIHQLLSTRSPRSILQETSRLPEFCSLPCSQSQSQSRSQSQSQLHFQFQVQSQKPSQPKKLLQLSFSKLKPSSCTFRKWGLREEQPLNRLGGVHSVQIGKLQSGRIRIGRSGGRKWMESAKASSFDGGMKQPEENYFEKSLLDFLAFMQRMPREIGSIKWPNWQNLLTVATITAAVVAIMIVFLSTIDQLLYWLLARSLKKSA